MKKKSLIVISLLIIGTLIGLCVANWYIDSKTEALEIIEVPLSDFDTSDIIQIDFNEKRTQSFIKQEDKWINQEQPDVYYNQALIKNAVNQISKLKSYKVVKNVQDPAVYGIHENAKMVTIYNTINEASTYRIGNKVPEENATYIWSDEKEVLALVLDINLASIMVPTNEMVDPLLEVPAFDETREIKVSKKGQLIMQAERGADENWQMKAPFQSVHEVEKGQIENYISLLSAIKKDKIVEENLGDLEKYGLIEPALSITLNDNFTLNFGNIENGYRYFNTTQDTGIYQVKEESVNPISEIEPFTWITKTLYKPDRKTLKEVAIQYMDKNYTLQLKEAVDVPNLNGHLLDGTTKETILKGLEDLVVYSYLSNTSFEENNPRPAEITIHYTDLENQVVTLEFVPYDPSFYLLRINNHIEFSVEKKMLIDFINTLDNIIQSYTKQ